MRSLALILLGFSALASQPESARPAPPFILLRGGTANQPLTDLAAHRGRIVLMTFIDTNCSHCQDLTRNVLIPVQQDYSSRGVQVLECAFNQNAGQEVPGFIARLQPPFPVGWNTREAVYGFLEISILDQRPLYVPHVVIIDRRGAIVGDYRGESDFMKNPGQNIREELNKLLAENNASHLRRKR